MTRIIAGVARGRRLATPRGGLTRPTTDRTREAVFSTIGSQWGDLAGVSFLDLYAGSGAVGLEAWSRGATRVRFVESDPAAARIIAENAQSLGCAGAEVLRASVPSVLAKPPSGGGFDVIYLDPPYAQLEEELEVVLSLLVPHWLAPDALVVIERSRRAAEPRWPAGVAVHQRRTYGESAVWYGRATIPPSSPPSSGTPAQGDPDA